MPASDLLVVALVGFSPVECVSLKYVFSLLFQPRVETKPEVQSQPPRVREQRPRERPGFPPRGPRPGESAPLQPSALSTWKLEKTEL